MHALITGGGGFIGSHLTRALMSNGHDVTVLDNFSSGKLASLEDERDNRRLRVVTDTVMNETVVDRLISETDVVFHLAAAVGVEMIVRDPVHVIETNVQGTSIILRAARRYGRKVLLASTSEIYGKNTETPFAEEHDRVVGPTTMARWSYSASKAVDEFLALAYYRQWDLPVVIFRLFNTIGPRQTGQYGMVVPRLVQQALSGSPLTVYGDGQQTRCFCDVQDVVRALVQLADSEAAIGEVFNVGSTAETTILDLAKEILRLVPGVDANEVPVGADEHIRFIAYEEAYGPGFEDMRHRVPDISKIQTTIGWQPEISLKESLLRIRESEISTLRQ